MSAVLITGAAAGIGRATADLLLAQGVGIVGVDRAPMPDLGQGFRAIQADLSRAEAITTTVAEAISVAPGLAGLVNCAGIYPVAPALDLASDEWDAVLSVNLRAPFLLSQALARHWREIGVGGAIVNVASTAANLARPGVAHYAASKAGLVQMTKVLAVEFAPLGIRVNAIAPGLIATEKVMAHAAGAGAQEHATKLARIPAAREGTPEEVAKAIAWLLSDDATYANGAVLTLDGGFTLGIPAY